jgi:photosystem II stability/assembly factor-like uncharacterized protein
MVQRKFYLGTAAGIVAYEGSDEANGRVRFQRVLHALPERFFGQVLADAASGTLLAGAVRGLSGVLPGWAAIPRFDPAVRTGPVVYRSADAGATWEASDQGITIGGVRAFARDDASGAIYATGNGPPTLFRSQDAGRTWEELPALKQHPTAKTWLYHPGPPRHSPAYNPSIAWSCGVLYINVEEGWPYRSDDGGASWHPLRNGVFLDAHVIRPDPTNPSRVWLASAYGLVRSDNRGETWEYVDFGDIAPREYMTGLAINPRDPNVVVCASSNQPIGATLYGAGARVHRTTDGGATWHDLQNGLPFPMPGQVCLAEFDQHDGLYVGTDSGDLYFSPDAGERWSDVDHRLPIRHLQKNSLAALSVAAPDDPAAVFFAGRPEPVGVGR